MVDVISVVSWPTLSLRKTSEPFPPTRGKQALNRESTQGLPLSRVGPMAPIGKGVETKCFLPPTCPGIEKAQCRVGRGFGTL